MFNNNCLAPQITAAPEITKARKTAQPKPQRCQSAIAPDAVRAKKPQNALLPVEFPEANLMHTNITPHSDAAKGAFLP